MLKRTSALVIGAGLSGCAAAHQLSASGVDYLLVDKNPEIGGLTRSISIGPATFDYTGHFLHLARVASPEDLPFANQSASDWTEVERNSMVYLAGEFVPAPLQYHVGRIPDPLRTECITTYHSRPGMDCAETFGDYMEAGFGRGLCEAFLFPYNTKALAMDPASLSTDAVKRFFPPPDDARIVAGFSDAQTVEGASTYNSTFWYPTSGGIGRLACGLGNGLEAVECSAEVLLVDLCAHTIETSMGSFGYDQLLSSIPLDHLCVLTGDQVLAGLASGLSHNSVACINILLHGQLPGELADAHWVYLPDPSTPIYRFGCYSNIQESMAPTDHSAVYCEIAAPGGTGSLNAVSPITAAIESLENLGWVNRCDVSAVTANWIDCAYVHFLPDTTSRVAQIRAYLRDRNVWTFGRYGNWDYISMEDAIFGGIMTAKEAYS